MIAAALGALILVLTTPLPPVDAEELSGVVVQVCESPKAISNNCINVNFSRGIFLYRSKGFTMHFGGIALQRDRVAIGTKIRKSFNAKNVDINNFPKNIKFITNSFYYFLICDETKSIFIVNIMTDRSGLTMQLSTRMQNLSWNHEFTIKRDQRNIRVNNDRRYSFDRRVIPQFYSWRLAMVLYDNFSGWISTDNKINQYYWPHRNIGSQLPLSGSFSVYDQGIGRTPKEQCAYPQNYCRDSEDACKQGYCALSVKPFQSAAYKRAPFFPVFICGALTYITCMLSSIYIYDRAWRLSAQPKRKWRRRLLKGLSLLVAVMGSVSFFLSAGFF